MKVGDLVDYQVDAASWGTGRVVAYNAESEIVTVKDEDDGTIWRSVIDKTEPAGSEENP